MLWTAILIDVGGKLETSFFYLIRRGCLVVLAIKSLLKFSIAVKRTGIFLSRRLKMLLLNLQILKIQAKDDLSSGNRRFPGDIQIITQK